MKNDSTLALIVVAVILVGAALLMSQSTVEAVPLEPDKFYWPPEPITFCIEKTGNSRNIWNVTAVSIREGQYGEDPDFSIAYHHEHGTMQFVKENQWICSPSFGIAPETHCILSVDRSDQRQAYVVTSGELFQEVAVGQFQEVSSIGFPEWPIFLRTHPQDELDQYGACPMSWLPNVTYGYPAYPSGDVIYKPTIPPMEVTK